MGGFCGFGSGLGLVWRSSILERRTWSLEGLLSFVIEASGSGYKVIAVQCGLALWEVVDVDGWGVVREIHVSF